MKTTRQYIPTEYDRLKARSRSLGRRVAIATAYAYFLPESRTRNPQAVSVYMRLKEKFWDMHSLAPIEWRDNLIDWYVRGMDDITI